MGSSMEMRARLAGVGCVSLPVSGRGYSTNALPFSQRFFCGNIRQHSACRGHGQWLADDVWQITPHVAELGDLAQAFRGRGHRANNSLADRVFAVRTYCPAGEGVS